MEKVLIIIPDTNKGKFISKGYASAFREESYFVIEKKIYDLNIEEVKKISPNLIFYFWADNTQNKELIELINNYKNENTIFIHYAEVFKDIPSVYSSLNNHYCFSSDNKNKEYRLLPAVNSDDYKRKFKGYKYLITFAGNPVLNNREIILSRLIYNFGIINIFCRSYDFYKSVDDIYRNKYLNDKYIDLYRESYRGYVENQEEISYIYSSSKINVDIRSKKEKPINYRCMEIMASGGFLITEYNDVVVENFETGRELETYKTDYELTDKIRFYLKNLNLAQLITTNGKRNVVSNHSFRDRVKIILKVVNDKNTCN